MIMTKKSKKNKIVYDYNLLLIKFKSEIRVNGPAVTLSITGAIQMLEEVALAPAEIMV